MRILAIHARGIVAGGSDGVYVHGTHLLAERGHQIAWLTVGPCEIAAELNHPTFALPEFREKSPFRRHLRIAEGLIYSPRANALTQASVTAFRPDVAHVHTIRGILAPSILTVLKKYGVPVVQTLHDYRLLCPVNSFLSGTQVCEACKGKRYYHCIWNRCGRDRSLIKSAMLGLSGYAADYLYHYDDLVTTYIAPGEFLRQKMIEFGYAATKIITLPNAYFGYPMAPQESSRTHVLYVGRLAREKGIDLLVKATVGLDTPVIVAGDGPERDSLESLADALGAHNVRFVGFQPPATIADLYNRAIATVLPSRWYENGPLVILESYARGTPVIGANIGAIPEFVQPGETGFLFRAGDAQDLREVLLECVADRKKLAQMGRAARDRVVAKYSPERYVQSLENVLESAIRQHTAASSAQHA